MTDDHSMERPLAGGEIAGEVVGHGLCRLAPRDVPALRRRPGPVPEGWGRVSPGLLRYSDEQTVAGTTAVFSAMDAMGVPPRHFEGWGVVAASRYLGRANLAQVLRNFATEGVWGVSPHLIPHFALHSPSGTISLALGLHGPNLGVGGGVHSPAEGFLASLTWLAAGVVPGVWLVLSGWSPELVPGRPGDGSHPGECVALALALVAAPSRARGPAFRVAVGVANLPAPAPIDLAWLADRLGRRDAPVRRTIATDPGGRLGVEFVPGREAPRMMRHAQG